MNSSEFRYSAVVGEETGKILADALDARLVDYTKDEEDDFEKSHLTGHTVISQLNRIFGYGGHSWEVIAGPKLIGSTGVDQQTGEIDSAIGYTCTGRLTVSTQSGPVSFDGVGVEKLDGLSFNCHDKALKGAETDAMKRAARHLGAQFGLSLYFGGAFDVPAHFRVEGGQPPAKAEAAPASQPEGGQPPAKAEAAPASQPEGAGASQGRRGGNAQNRRPAQSQARGGNGSGQKAAQNGGQKPRQNGGQKPRQNGGRNGGQKPLEPMPKLEQLNRQEAEGLLIDYAMRQSDKVTEEIVRQQVLDHTGKPLAELDDAELRKMIASSYRKLRGS